MRRGLVGVASVVCLASLAPLALWGDREQEPTSQSDLRQRYLLLSTIKTSTMQEELDTAAAAGYRAVVGARTGSSEFAVLLEKVAQPPEVYEYRLLATTRTSTMQEELNDAAADGFHILSRVMMGGQSEIVVLLERPPGPPLYSEYLLLATELTGTLHAELAQAAAQGWNLLGMVRAEEKVGLSGEHIVTLGRAADIPRVPGVASLTELRERYLGLATRRTATMQKELAEAAKKGYRVVTASPTSGTELEIIMEKQAEPADAFEYKLIATNRASTLQKELNEEARRGFRLLPQALVGKRGAGSSGWGSLLGVAGGTVTIPGMVPDEIVAVLERAPESTTRYQYLVLDTMRTSTMQEEISTTVSEQAYKVAAMAGGPTPEEATPLGVMAALRIVLEKELEDQ